jgi:leucyl-tRNA synthetase
MSVERYNARVAEIHWQLVWDTQNVFATRDDDPRPRHDVPVMFQHPTERIHMGHVRDFTMRDVVARYKRANGFNVRPLLGWHAFAMPAENAAAVTGGTHRRASTHDKIVSMRVQLRSMGLALDLSREITTCDPQHDRGRQAASRADREKALEGLLTPRTVMPETCRNTIDADDIIDTYGADAVRWFVLFDSPPDRGVIWSENGIHGAWRFVQRLWRLINNVAKFSEGAQAARPAEFPKPALKVRTTAHRALMRVSGNIERLRFNVCIAHMYALARVLEAIVANSPEPASPDLKFAAREAAEILVQLFHPMMPHLAEECWAALGHDSLLATRNWPAIEADLLVEDTFTLSVHVNGRKRADVTVARDARNGDIEASVLALDVVRRALDGKAPRKVIIVPQRIINVVA